uniref:Ion transport domain-containing protein n=1 Tax=Guillardia theta (strain CCMP2712) TaxID=905079 RepID=A0A0C3SLA6_GUITC
MHPNSMPRMLWDLWMFFITSFALVTDPLGLGLLPDSVPFFDATDRLITAVFMMDIVLNFLTGYINKKERCVIMSWHDVAVRYLTTWLGVDIISSLPPEAFTSNKVSETSMIKAMRITKILTFFKISRLARVVEVI